MGTVNLNSFLTLGLCICTLLPQSCLPYLGVTPADVSRLAGVWLFPSCQRSCRPGAGGASPDSSEALSARPAPLELLTRVES